MEKEVEAPKHNKAKTCPSFLGCLIQGKVTDPQWIGASKFGHELNHVVGFFFSTKDRKPHWFRKPHQIILPTRFPLNVVGNSRGIFPYLGGDLRFFVKKNDPLLGENDQMGWKHQRVNNEVHHKNLVTWENQP